jgi:hypothetical protein
MSAVEDLEKVTVEERREMAVAYIAANPHATVTELCDAIGLGQAHGARSVFVAKLIDLDLVYLVPSDPERR